MASIGLRIRLTPSFNNLSRVSLNIQEQNYIRIFVFRVRYNTILFTCQGAGFGYLIYSQWRINAAVHGGFHYPEYFFLLVLIFKKFMCQDSIS